MNIFKSKEIYKKVPGVSPQSNPLRAVRGVWVSGEHRDPYCIDSVIQIIECASNHCDVADYTSTTASIYDKEVIKLTGVYVSNDFEIITYHDTTATLHRDNMIRVNDVYSADFEIIYYTTLNQKVYQDNELRLSAVYPGDDFEIIYEYNTSVNKETTPEPMIHVLEHSSGNIEFGTSILSDD